MLALSSSQFDPEPKCALTASMSAIEGKPDIAKTRHKLPRLTRLRLPIDYCALRGPDLYAILHEDDRTLCLARADEDDGIVRLIDALDDAALGARVCDDLREAFRAKAQKRREVLAHFTNHQLGRVQRWPRAGH
jgi:hypothetical protein